MDRSSSVRTKASSSKRVARASSAKDLLGDPHEDTAQVLVDGPRGKQPRQSANAQKRKRTKMDKQARAQEPGERPHYGWYQSRPRFSGLPAEMIEALLVAEAVAKVECRRLRESR